MVKANGKMLFVFDLEKKTQVSKVLSSGKGPCEQTILVGLYGKKNSVGWYEPNLKKYCTFSIHEAMRDELAFCPTISIDFKKLGGKSRYAKIIPLGSDHYLGYISLSNKRNESYYLLDSLGNSISTFGSFPTFGGKEDIPSHLLKKIHYNANLYFNEKLNKLVTIGTRGLLETNLWDPITSSLKLERRLKLYDPIISIKKNYVAVKDHSIIGCSLASFTDRYIYFIFDTSTNGKYYKKDPLLGIGHDLICVFDYDLRPVRRIITARPFFAFGVKADDSKLYTICNTPKPTIIEYDL